MACVGQDAAARSKFLEPTPPQLQCEDLRARLECSGLHPTFFQKNSGVRPDFSLKPLLRQNRARLPLETPKFSRSPNEWLLLAG
jgi:hypothetical protein